MKLTSTHRDKNFRDRVPLSLLTAAGLATIFLALPLAGLLQKAPWSALASYLTSQEFLQAAWLSLVVSFSAALVCLLCGLPLAWVLARWDIRPLRVVRALALLPMVLPPVVAGNALLSALGRRSLVGQWLESWFGVGLTFTTAGAIVAAAFVSMPFVVIAVESALLAQGRDLEEAAAVSGAGPLVTFATVTVPAIKGAIAAGLVLAWARAVGEFGATIAFTGSFPGRTRTLPLEIYVALEHNRDAATAMSVFLLLTSFAVLVALRGRWLRR